MTAFPVLVSDDPIERRRAGQLPRFSVISGGLACILGTFAIAKWSPRILSYEYDPDGPK